MMQIIFDKELASTMANKYTVLELDTVMQEGLSEPITLYAVVDRIPIEEIPNLGNYRELHEQLIAYYKSGRWDDARGLVPVLKGKWSGDLDTFYDNIDEFMTHENLSEWQGIRHTEPRGAAEE